MATQQSIDHLVGLAVAMLGVAPGTDWLNARAKQLDGGATLADIANEIQSSSAFEDKYPAFLTNERFAKDFLEALLGDHVDDAVMTAAVDFVAGQLAGASRGELALALVDALTIIGGEGGSEADMAFRELHSGNFGKAAAAFHNKVMVAKHYTEEARMEDPSASVLEGVTDAAESVTAAINLIDNPPQPPAEPETGKRFVLTPTIDDIEGTDFDDTIVAAPVQGSNNNFSETLNAFDSIDGGGGTDTIRISGDGDLSIELAQVSNVEVASIRTPGSIDADMSDWTGLESVDIGRFGSASDVTVIVDGAAVSINERLTIGGDATIVGADGAVDIKAGSGSDVVVGSGDHTESVMVKGGASVTVGKNANGGGQSQTVTAVVVDGVQHNTGTTTMVDSDEFNPRVDDDGFVVAANGTTRVALSADGNDFTRLTLASDGVTLENGGATVGGFANGAPITITFTHTATGGNTSVITAGLKFDAENGGIVLGEVTASTDTEVLALADAKTTYEGMAIPDGEIVVPTPSIGKESKGEVPRTEGGGPTLTVNSDAIEMVHLHNTTATVLVQNNSKTADNKNMPEDLAITVNKYGIKEAGKDAVYGKLCVAGAGSAENIALTVAGDSWVDLNSNVVKMLDITTNAKTKLDLTVSKFDRDGNPDGASNTLETVKASGAGNVTMGALAGMAKLKTIDASESSGDNHFKSTATLAALETVMGGSGKDKVELVSAASGTGSKLMAIHTRDGDDTVDITGAHRTAGLMVDLGAGNDTFEGNSGGNKNSRINGGEGVDTLKLSATPATYKDDGKDVSIYSNFEVLDVGGGAGEYDVALLGVDTVVARGGTAGTDLASGVTLENMADGMGITVHGTKGMATNAYITHELPEALRRASGDLDVSLLAIGADDDTKSATGTTGEVTLTLAVDSEIEALNVDSSATVGGSKTTPASNRPGAANYHNMLELDGPNAAGVEDIVVTGGSMLTITGTGAALDLIDASRNTGGVTFDGSAATQNLELVGGDGVDTFTGGAGVDEIEGGDGDDVLAAGTGGGELTGGAGGDSLTGGSGVADDFIIKAVSDSQLSFNARTGAAEGVDTIMDFETGADDIVLPKSLFNSLRGTVKDVDGTGTVDVNTHTAAVGGLASSTLKAYLESSTIKNGFFETDARTLGTAGALTKHPVTVIRENDDDIAGVDNTWIFIDIDGDGDLDLSVDHVIKLDGDIAFDISTDLASA